ncbi:ATP-dependent DNA helicase RecG [Candidatus Peribacteria bacterium RIFCSPHIGHO2_01_FULL_51_9]|nr:MAG: ATP-dependent DNA helicase RecG [Candidatus Peribacteria bacterium RIFCSPHIGHO2_01_FULL_51_9]
MHLCTPLKEVLRTTADYICALENMSLRTIEDLLLYLPRRHEDLRATHTIAHAPLGEKVTLRGEVRDVKLIHTKKRKKIVTAIFTDAEGMTVEVIWFNQPHVKRMLKDGDEIVITGKIVEDGRKLKIFSPQFEKDRGGIPVHGGRLVPVYPQHDKVTTRWLREKMHLIKDAIEELSETLPQDVIDSEGLLSRKEAIRAMHFPDDAHMVEKAFERLTFEEMYHVQREALTRKQEWQGKRQERLRIVMDPELMKTFFASLHFTPTGSQKIAIFEILKDMERDYPMSRLLEGDVGSGKTLVACAVMAHVIRHGGQCALMVPTEVLARQHIASIGKILLHFFEYYGRSVGKEARLPSIALLTGSMSSASARDIKRSIATGTVDLVIGTHALIEEDVRFRNLLFVIVDEQHRFGVVQRERLLDKGNPHFLSMTATPIPRTLALTAYGHHDLSVLTEKPGNRQAIHTKVVTPKDRRTVEQFIDRQMEEGRQVFVICPLIEESLSDEVQEVRNVQVEARRLMESFPHRRIAVLHGRMPSQEKEEVMRAFKEGRHDLLVSTSVIEVGIDVPNASVMVIEGAERFGLSQLHQFRGRVGRGVHKSYCFLFTTIPAQTSSQRLHAMEQHDNGFLLAEIDLKIRGPGELFGIRQSGIPEMRIAGLLNPELVVRARRAAERVMGRK